MTSDESESIHYDFRREPTQHEPGPRAPMPLNHELRSHADGLISTLEACDELWSVARHPRTDATWPRHRAILRQSERVLVEYLRLVQFYLGDNATQSPTCPEMFEEPKT